MIELHHPDLALVPNVAIDLYHDLENVPEDEIVLVLENDRALDIIVVKEGTLILNDEFGIEVGQEQTLGHIIYHLILLKVKVI